MSSQPDGSHESVLAYRIENNYQFIREATADLALRLEFDRPPAIRNHINKIKAEAIVADVGPHPALEIGDVRSQVPLALYPVQITRAWAFTLDHQAVDDPELEQDCQPHDKPRFEIVNPIYPYDAVLVNWAEFRQAGVQTLSIAGSYAIDAFVADLREHAHHDPNFNLLADLTILAANYAQRIIPD